MGCSASRADGLEHEEALQHVIKMMRELIYTFFQRSGNRERYAVVIRGVICGLS